MARNKPARRLQSSSCRQLIDKQSAIENNRRKLTCLTYASSTGCFSAHASGENRTRHHRYRLHLGQLSTEWHPKVFTGHISKCVRPKNSVLIVPGSQGNWVSLNPRALCGIVSTAYEHHCFQRLMYHSNYGCEFKIAKECQLSGTKRKRSK